MSINTIDCGVEAICLCWLSLRVLWHQAIRHMVELWGQEAGHRKDEGDVNSQDEGWWAVCGEHHIFGMILVELGARGGEELGLGLVDVIVTLAADNGG